MVKIVFKGLDKTICGCHFERKKVDFDTQSFIDESTVVKKHTQTPPLLLELGVL